MRSRRVHPYRVMSTGNRPAHSCAVMRVPVLGGGPAGTTAALQAGELGADVTLIEAKRLGGTSLNEGPAPIRTLARAARLIRDTRSWGRFGLRGDVGSPSTSTSGTGSALATDAALKNLVMFGSVNANRRHYHRAAKVLANADRSWLEQFLTRRVRPDAVGQALVRTPDDIKVVMESQQP